MREAVIVSSVRTPVARAPKGALSTTRPDDLAAATLNAALARIPSLSHEEIDDLVLGCAQPEGEQGWCIARWVILRAGLPVSVPGVTVNRLCSSGLEAIAQAAAKIESGGQTVNRCRWRRVHVHPPLWRPQAQPQPLPRRHLPRLHAHHGTHRRARRHPLQNLPRRSGRLPFASHQKALAAQAAGKFDSELIPIPITRATPGKVAANST